MKPNKIGHQSKTSSLTAEIAVLTHRNDVQEGLLVDRLASHSIKFRAPRRLVTRSGARLRGKHYSIRHPSALPWETVEERLLIQVLDASIYTERLVSQPVTLEIRQQDDCFEYTPDVVVERFGQITIFECKPQELINQPEWQQRLNQIANFFKGMGVNFIAFPNEVQPILGVQQNITKLLLTGTKVQYPTNRREEDWEIVSANKPDTFWRDDRVNRATSCTWNIGFKTRVRRHALPNYTNKQNLLQA